MAPSLGHEWYVSGPASQNGITLGAWNRAYPKQSETVVGDMCVALVSYATGRHAVMCLHDYWHCQKNQQI